MPAATDDPFAGGRALGLAGDEVDHFLPACGLREVELAFGVAKAEEVAVAFDEAGHDHLARNVDDARGAADQRFDFLLAADGGDFFAADGEGFGSGLLIVESDDFGIEQDQVSGLRPSDQRKKGNVEIHG
jgi:hypothetical protein